MAEVRPTVLMDEIRIEREGIVLGWAPLASLTLHLLLLVLVFWLSEVSLRHHPPPEQEKAPLQITFQRIPGLHVEGGRGGGLPQRAGSVTPRGAAPTLPTTPGTSRSTRSALPPSPAGERAGEETKGAAEPTPAPTKSMRSERALDPAARTESPAERARAFDPDRPTGFSVQRALRDFRRSLGAGPPGAVTEGTGGADGSGSPGGLNIPDLPPLPDTGFGFGNLRFESRDFDWTDYARQIYIAIWRAWHNRLYLTTDSFEKWGYQNRLSLLDHQSGIQFTIERSGQVTGVTIEAPSGCAPLDDSAVDALEEVVLPPLPGDFPRGRETVHARFIAQGEIRAMRPTLEYLRARGFF